jgi:hypothetical protein
MLVFESKLLGGHLGLKGVKLGSVNSMAGKCSPGFVSVIKLRRMLHVTDLKNACRILVYKILG